MRLALTLAVVCLALAGCNQASPSEPMTVAVTAHDSSDAATQSTGHAGSLATSAPSSTATSRANPTIRVTGQAATLSSGCGRSPGCMGYSVEVANPANGPGLVSLDKSRWILYMSSGATITIRDIQGPGTVGLGKTVTSQIEFSYCHQGTPCGTFDSGKMLDHIELNLDDGTSLSAPIPFFWGQSQTAMSCTYSAGPGYENAGLVATYSWNFGDGTSGNGQTVTHEYAQNKLVTVLLTVNYEGKQATYDYIDCL